MFVPGNISLSLSIYIYVCMTIIYVHKFTYIYTYTMCVSFKFVGKTPNIGKTLTLMGSVAEEVLEQG